MGCSRQTRLTDPKGRNLPGEDEQKPLRGRDRERVALLEEEWKSNQPITASGVGGTSIKTESGRSLDTRYDRQKERWKGKIRWWTALALDKGFHL